jgi:hypothetical protein
MLIVLVLHSNARFTNDLVPVLSRLERRGKFCNLMFALIASAG